MLIILLFIFLSNEIFACSKDGKNGILPPNNLSINTDDALKRNHEINELVFNKIIDQIAHTYRPVINSKSARLIVKKNWKSPTVNAFASQEDDQWIISLYGGLARHPDITKDGFALVVCHELGHHIGGVPRYDTDEDNWCSNEGQADYFSTLKCLRTIFENDDNQNIVKNMIIPLEVKIKCEEEFNAKNEQYICQRSAMAGLSFARLNQEIRKDEFALDFSTPDPRVARTTQHDHPNAQCRLDTYFAGAICPVQKEIEIGQEHEDEGVCYESFGHQNGARPQCWFKESNFRK